jgi:predicted transcriptional regulator
MPCQRREGGPVASVDLTKATNVDDSVLADYRVGRRKR